MTTINYSNKVEVKFLSADNFITAYIDPTFDGASMVEIYASNNKGTPSLNVSMDITDTMTNAFGTQDVIFLAIGSNTYGGGLMHFQIFVDGQATPVWEINESLSQWTSKQWSVTIHKN